MRERFHPDPEINQLTYDVLGCCIEVHKHLGPGLLESAYAACVAHELELRGFNHVREVPLPVEYKGVRLDCGYRMDAVIENRLLLEIKAVEALAEIHEAQCYTYMRFSGLRLCLLINFNVIKLMDGVRRLIQ